MVSQLFIKDIQRWGAKAVIFLALGILYNSHANAVPNVRWDYFTGVMSSSDSEQMSFSLLLADGKTVNVQLTTDTYGIFLANHSIGTSSTPAIPSNKEILNKWKGRMVSVGGVINSDQPDTIMGKKVVLIETANGDSLTESDDWWKDQARAIAKFWMDAQGLNPQVSASGSKTDAGYYRTIVTKTGDHRDQRKLVNRLQETATFSRLIYGLSSSFLITGNQEFLDAAKAMVEYQRKYMRFDIDNQKVMWLHAYDPCGTEGNKNILPSLDGYDKDTIPLYEQIYALAGLTQYYRITQDSEVLTDIQKTLSFMDSYFWDSQQHGYYSHISPKPFQVNADPTIALKRKPALDMVEKLNLRKKNWNSIGDHLPAYLINLYLGTGNTVFLNRLDNLAHIISTRFPVSDSPFVLERFDESWLPDLGYGWQQDRGVVGHNMKIVWVLTQMYYLMGNQSFLSVAKLIADNMSEHGEDIQRGGWFDVIERHFDPQTNQYNHVWHSRKAWWQQEQGILGSYILYSATKESKYLNSARRGAAFYNEAFLDHYDGGVFFDAMENGIPFLNDDKSNDKGSHAKGGYHELELAYYAHLYSNLLVKSHPVTLYYQLHSSSDNQVLRVQPIVLPKNSVYLKSVEVNGHPYTNFDSVNMTVQLPESNVPLSVVVTIEPQGTNQQKEVSKPKDAVSSSSRIVTLVGSLQKVLGHSQIWDPSAEATRMMPLEDGVYSLTGLIPEGRYEYKAALNGSWTDNYGKDGVPGGENILLELTNPSEITFYYSDVSKRITDSTKYKWLAIPNRPTLSDSLAYAVGNPIALTDFDLDNIYTTKLKVPEGDYQFEIGFHNKSYQSEVKVTNLHIPTEISFDTNTLKTTVDTGLLSQSQPYHDTFSRTYRSPFEAVPVGNYVHIRLSTKAGTVKEPNVIFTEGRIDRMGGVIFDGPCETLKMYKLPEDHGQHPGPGRLDFWEVKIEPSKLGVYGYKFQIDQLGQYGDDVNPGGEGQSASISNVFFRLTAFDATYETPDWFKGAIVYQIFPDRFLNGDTSNDRTRQLTRDRNPLVILPWKNMPSTKPNEYFAGDLNGIRKKLDYIQELGVSVLYLNPFLIAGANHRYDYADLFRIDPMFGTKEEFIKFSEELNKRNMHLIMDGIFSHCGDDSIYFDRYSKYPWVGAYEFWSTVYGLMENEKIDLESAKKKATQVLASGGQKFSPANWHNWFSIRNKKVDTGNGQWRYEYDSFSGFDSLPEFKRELHEQKEWMNYFLFSKNSVVHYWQDAGVSGWRLDVAPHLGHEFPRILRSELAKVPLKDGKKGLFLAEIFNDATSHLLGDQFDSVMNYPFKDAILDTFLIQGNAEVAQQQLLLLRQNYPQEAFMSLMNLIGSHDTTRAIFHLGGGKSTSQAISGKNFDYELGKKRLKLAVAFQMGYPGSPTIYYGDEVGLVGSSDPDNRRTFPWESEDKDLLHYYQSTASFRSNYLDLFRKGDLIELYAKGGVYVFARRLDSQFAIVAINRDDYNRDLDIDLRGEIGNGVTMFDGLDIGYQVVSCNNQIKIDLPAMTARILVAERIVAPAAELPAFSSEMLLSHEIKSAQLLGTVNSHRGRWNIFLPTNDMEPDTNHPGTFFKRIDLSEKGGRNADGTYSIRFSVNHDFNRIYKIFPQKDSPNLLTTGDGSLIARNIVFRVMKDGEYQVRFLPNEHIFSIEPGVEYINEIESIEVNGFVWDKEEGKFETRNDERTFPIQKWDETSFYHDMVKGTDGFWTKKIYLNTKGGMAHRQDGIYQMLFSANHIGDWGFCAINGHPGYLSEGCSYDGKSGTLLDSDVVFRVRKDAWYTISMNPEKHSFEISPKVEILNQPISYQVNGPVVVNPWDPSDPSHEMEKDDKGLWKKKVSLSSEGGPGNNGVYSLNISINNEWLLDSLGFGAWILDKDKKRTRVRLWHTKPQEPNIVFRIVKTGEYKIIFDPTFQEMVIEPAVEPAVGIKSTYIVGDLFEDPRKNWQPLQKDGMMDSLDGIRFSKTFQLIKGRTYSYKYVVNQTGFLWSFADYVFDGYGELSIHGNPPALTFTPPESGCYSFEANILTGDYRVYPYIKVRDSSTGCLEDRTN